jgi:TonB family protein
MAHYVLGVIDLRLWRNREAEQEADTAISLRPKFGAAYLLKSQALLALEGDESSKLAKVVNVGGSQPSESEKEQRKDRARKAREHFAAAASALETYLNLVASDSETATWKEQLDTLKVYARQSPTKIYSGSEVTTKVRVLAKPEPMYTSQARDAGIAGTVILRAVFTAYGTVDNILVVRSLPAGLTAASVQAARRIKFTPATMDGKPVPVFMELQYNFNFH